MCGMKNRFFIAINIPDGIKDKIETALDRIRFNFTNDIRFLDRGNWHITITFLGWQDNEFLIPIIDSIKKTAYRFSPMEIELANIDYGPQNKPPRMIWLNAGVPSSQNLSILKNDLDENFRTLTLP